jgi:hypothetical protein
MLSPNSYVEALYLTPSEWTVCDSAFKQSNQGN